MFESKFFRALELRLRAGRSYHVRPRGKCKLKCRSSNSASDGVNQQNLAGRETELSRERIVCGEKRFRNRSCFFEREIRGNWNRFTLVDAEILGMRASAGDSRYARTDVPECR